MTRAQQREAVDALVDAAMRMLAAATALDACEGCQECAAHAPEMRGAAALVDEWIAALQSERPLK